MSGSCGTGWVSRVSLTRSATRWLVNDVRHAIASRNGEGLLATARYWFAARVGRLGMRRYGAERFDGDPPAKGRGWAGHEASARRSLS